MARHIIEACRLGDLERIKALAAAPDFDVNAGYLVPMPGCGEDIIPYTTDDEREKLNEQLIKRYRRIGSLKCTMLLYPLQVVCQQQHPFQPEVAAYLIDELGADTEILVEDSRPRGEKKVTMLTNAVHNGRMEVVEFLRERGAKAKSPWERGGVEAANCILSAAASSETEMLQHLLGDEERAKCFDLSCRDKFGRTPLNLACVLERTANVEILLRHGGLGVAVSPEDVRAACNECNAAILTLLLDHGGALPPDNEVVTMLSFRDDVRALAFLELLRSRGVDLAEPYTTTQGGVAYSFFALHDATMNGAESCIEFLLSVGADPDAVGCSPDHQKPGVADDWEGNLDLQYGHVYGDGVCLIPSRVAPVKALFARARKAKRGGGVLQRTSKSQKYN